MSDGPRSALADRLAAVDARIADAAAAAGRSPDELVRIVVTKFQPVAMIAELAGLGVRDVGESRHQEAQAKAAELDALPLTWHFVGQLQSKKARQAARYASVVHSVDRASLVDALAGAERRIGCFVQLDLTGEPGRGGVDADEALRLADRVAGEERLDLLGVMAVAPREGDPRRAFATLRDLSDRVRAGHPGAVSISAGMSGDFADAIAAGATHLRLGVSITGPRPADG